MACQAKPGFSSFHQPLNGCLSIIEYVKIETTISADSFKKTKVCPIHWEHHFSYLNLKRDAYVDQAFRAMVYFDCIS